MKYLITIISFLLISCTSPQYIVLTDKNGNIVHSVHEEPFFSSPNKPSEWLFWYTPIALIAVWMIWKEVRKIILKDCNKETKP